MKLPSLLLSVCLFVFCYQLQAQTTIGPEVQPFVSHERGMYLLQNLNLVDGTGGPVKTNQDILIDGDRILKMGSDLPVPQEATVINMQGKSAIPGLVMLHEHFFYPKSTSEMVYGVDQMSYSFPKLYLAGGVTSLRTAGSIMPQSDVNIKKRIERGETPGPKMDVTSPHMDREGKGLVELGTFDSPEKAVRAIDYYADLGITSIKVYNFITKEDLKAIIKAAHARGMKVTGHLCSVTYREAADLGIDNLEHGFFASSDFIKDKPEDYCDPMEAYKTRLEQAMDSKEVHELIQHLIKKNVTLTSTINVFEPYTGREVVPGGGIDALFPMAKDKVFKRWARKQGRDSIDYHQFNQAKVWEKAFHDAGGLLVAGTDPTYDGRIVAGYANMRLVELFGEMGFTIPEAIKICTKNGATYLEQEDIGTLEEGKIADLVILNEDITQDLTAIRTIEIVFKNGIGYDSKKLFKAAEGFVGIR